MDSRDKIKSREALKNIRQQLAEDKKTVVFTNGCFDILHRGHADYLQKARNLGDVLILGLNDDDSVRRLKGNGRPIVPENDRAFILAALAAVDYVTVFPEDTPLALIETLVPDILVKGGDYLIENIVGGEIVQANGGKVLTIPFVADRSTSDVVRKIIKLNREGILN